MKGIPKPFQHVVLGMVYLLCFSLQTNILAQQAKVRIGAEILLEKHLTILQGKRVGVICNHTSTLSNKTHLVDTLLARGVNVTVLFSPEHGIRGRIPAGMKVNESVEEKTGLPIFPLYGNSRKPSAKILENVDVLIFDLQDAGARFYTYYITMSRAMEAAAEHNKVFIVLDRPNPINGIDIEGPILESSLQSDVGRFPLPIRHALTLGELAKMIVGEKWIGVFPSFTLIVIPMEGWKREMWYGETGLPWVPPSPNMKSLSTATVYPGMCLFEATNFSEGRGTSKPFQYIGAPWSDGKLVAGKLNSMKIPGVNFRAIRFIPMPDSITDPNPKYKGKQCSGIFIQVENRKTFRPVITALKMISVLLTLYPSQFEFQPLSFDKRAGTSSTRTGMEKGVPVESLKSSWSVGLEDFRKLRTKYLLY